MSVDLKTPDKSATLVRQAMDAVTGHIRSQRLRVGDSLPAEGLFATELGVSKSVVREAFGALAALNQIEVSNGRRARVAAINGSVLAASLDHAVSTAQVSVAQVWDVRRTLEVRTAALAALHRTPDQAARLIAIVESMESDAGNLDRITGHDIAFHQTIAEASGNELFHQIITSFGALMKVAVPTAWRTRATDEQRRTVLEHHRAVARAIADGSPEGAQSAMETHFDMTIDDLLAAQS